MACSEKPVSPCSASEVAPQRYIIGHVYSHPVRTGVLMGSDSLPDLAVKLSASVSIKLSCEAPVIVSGWLCCF